MMKKNPSLQRKSTARIAAVQCIYQSALTNQAPDAKKTIEAFTARHLETLRTDDEELTLDTEPDMKYFRKLVEGVCAHYAEFDAFVQTHLQETWKKERMSPLLMAILLTALYELKYHDSLATHIVIDEYVTLTGSFFAEPEQGFINAFLDKASRELRAGHA